METVILTKGKSFKEQEEICEGYARANGLNVIGYISSLQELEKYPDCKAVLVTKRNRISRNAFEVMIADFKLREKKIKLISVDGDTGRSSLMNSAFIEHIKKGLKANE